jgi:adenylate kinase family enzyme
LNAVLELPGGKKVVDVTIMNPYQLPNLSGGKSTIARQIAARTGATTFDLDNFLWKPGDPESAAAAREAEMARIISEGSWIAEGVYSDWAGTLMREADVIFWIEVPLPVAIWRIVTRHARRSLSGNNQYPGLIRLVRFLRWTVKYHISDRVGAIPSVCADWTRRNTRQYLAEFRAKVIGPRPRDVRSWLARLDQRNVP